MERNAVEVADRLVNGSGRGSDVRSISSRFKTFRYAQSYPENLSVRTDWISTFW